MSGSQQQHGGRVIRNRVQDFVRLFGGQRRVFIEQARGVLHGNIQRAGGITHGKNTRTALTKMSDIPLPG